MKKHEPFHAHAKPPKKSYTEFTAEMKNTHTILCPDIFPIHMHLLQEVFKMYGYHVRVLKDDGKKVIDTGLNISTTTCVIPLFVPSVRCFMH